jgi:predicted aspartyl protease
MSRTLAITLAASVVVAAPATAQVRLEHTSPAGSASTSTKTEASALVLGGTFVILATVNGAAQAAMRVDSGASDVMLPRTVAAGLISAGSLTPADYVTTKTYNPTASLILHDGLLPHLSAARTSRQSVRQSPREADAQGCD